MEEKKLVAAIKDAVSKMNDLFEEAGKKGLDVTPSFGYAVSPEPNGPSFAVMYIEIKKEL